MILLPIHPRHAEAILSGRKTMEVRKTERIPSGIAYLYATAPVSAIVGSVLLDYAGIVDNDGRWIMTVPPAMDKDPLKELCITQDELESYLKGADGHVYNAFNPERFVEPVKLSEVDLPVPQSFMSLNGKDASLTLMMRQIRMPGRTSE